MRHIVMDLHAPNVSPDVAFLRISDFARYPEYTDTVLAVDVEAAQADGSTTSHWEVQFRKGTLRWTERDVLTPNALRIEFTQLAGDFAVFEGHWQVDGEPGRNGVLIRFEAKFDMGIPSLAEIIEPVAESTLRGNVVDILTCLLGTVTERQPALETA